MRVFSLNPAVEGEQTGEQDEQDWFMTDSSIA
jgi:hypothetical protein